VGASLVILLGIGLAIMAAWWLRAGRLLAPAERAYAGRDWSSAVSEARKILVEKRDHVGALRLLARAEARLGRDQHARQLYKQLEPDDLQAEDYYLVGRGLITEGQFDEGRYGLARALDLDPGHAESLLELVRLDRRTDRLEKAAEEATRLSQFPSWSPRALVLLGLIEQSRQDSAAAARAFRSALEIDSSFRFEEASADRVRLALARCLLQLGLPDEAQTHLDALRRSRPDDPEAAWLSSRAALQSKDWNRALEWTRQSRGYGSDHPEAHEPATYVGFGRCGECHQKIVQAQRGSRHAQTFRTRGDLEDLPPSSGPRPDPFNPKYFHEVKHENGETVFNTRLTDGEMQAIVEFVLGSGDRAMTPVGRDRDGNWRELRMSHYHSIGDWDRTPGHALEPRQTHEYLGLVQDGDTLRRCLGCHTTHGRIGPGGSVKVPERGFSCERCHGPAGNHLLAMEGHLSDPAIGRPRLASASALNALCGQCHGAEGRGISPDDPEMARFQATSLPMSRCSSVAPESMSCLTCHDPHHNAERSPGYYESKCLECHAGNDRTTEDGDMPRRTCPVDPVRDCLRCHMPRVQTSVPHTTFTDHYIRVRHDRAG
jgi:tetratricopeptide (TPR) repeat protein